jgi:Fic family protein
MAPVRYHEGRFPPRDLDWLRLIPLLGPAAAAVARYDGLLGAIPSPEVLLSPLTTQEAVLSSRIEGTQATVGEVFEFEAGAEAASPEKPEDIHVAGRIDPSPRKHEWEERGYSAGDSSTWRKISRSR